MCFWFIFVFFKILLLRNWEIFTKVAAKSNNLIFTIMKQFYTSGLEPSRTVSGQWTAMGRRLLMMLLFFAFVGGVKASVNLPYTCGFENNNLVADGWIANISSSYSGIKSGGSEHSGSYGFAFSYSEQNASLISPLLTGGGNYTIEVSFWYKEYNSQYGDEQFYVGYTTDESVTNPDDFTYGDIITASIEWQQYQNTFPAGTKRIAIKYVYNDAYYLFLDDFEFDTNDGFKKPANFAVSEITN